MKVQGKHTHTIWEKGPGHIQVIDQRKLPFEFTVADITHPQMACDAIRDMWVRGAGLIGVCAGYGMYLAALEVREHTDFTQKFQYWAHQLTATRPTAVNLSAAVKRQAALLTSSPGKDELVRRSLELARKIKEEDIDFCRSIGDHGWPLIREAAEKKSGAAVNILTHCNAGWLAFADYGSALAPVYKAFDQEIPVHVWVDETRPRNQGARLTAWELREHGVPHTLITDNTGGHLMQTGRVDMVIVGADRVTRGGDAANKIGTYLKALAAKDTDVPFYVAFPSTTIDWSLADGFSGIPIEERSAREIITMEGMSSRGVTEFLVASEETECANFGFDITPARLITGLITERGICRAEKKSLRNLFPEIEIRT